MKQNFVRWSVMQNNKTIDNILSATLALELLVTVIYFGHIGKLLIFG